MREVVAPYLADTEKTRILMPDGKYLRVRDAGGPRYSQNGWHFNVQQFLIDSIQRQPEGVAFLPYRDFWRPQSQTLVNYVFRAAPALSSAAQRG